MQYEFLKHFTKRMKHVGMYAILMQNSAQKQTWKQYEFMTLDEQLNVIFALLLYIMEQSLKEENCTMDDIGAYLDDINASYYGKRLSYEDCKQLGDFIVNVILSNEGKLMHFNCFDFDEKVYKTYNISYVANRVVYIDTDLKRTSYYLTEQGYNLLLSTLEIENNMKLTIHEMIFKMLLERQSYDRAVDEVKNIFNIMRGQLQKIQDAMLRIKRNALNYSVADYAEILQENMATIGETKAKFQHYKEVVKKRAEEMEQQHINIKKLTEEEEENLRNLKIIEEYLSRALDEYQQILSSHFDLKTLYEKELQALTQMSLIKRFSLRTELYDKILEKPDRLDYMEYFFRPLFHQAPQKVYRLEKAMELQRTSRSKKLEEEEEVLDFGEEAWQEERRKAREERLKKYKGSLQYLLESAGKKGEITLDALQQQLMTEGEEAFYQCIPDVNIFKEIMVELLRNKEIDMESLSREKKEFIQDVNDNFSLNDMLLTIVEESSETDKLKKIEVHRIEDGKVITFEHVKDAYGEEKTIRCSNVCIRLLR